MRQFVWLGSLVGALVASAPATAGTLSAHDVVRGEADPDIVRVFTYDAGPGERNAITIEVTERALIVSEADRPVTALEECYAVSPTSGACPLPSEGAPPIKIRAGDEDDHVSMNVAAEGRTYHPQPTIYGGAGDDQLQATGGWVALHGQAGADKLIGGLGDQALGGGPGQDHIRGGPGGDFLHNGEEPEPARDLFDGGEGSDSISYRRTRANVVVDLSDEVGGRRREADRLRSIEYATGGGGNDVLIGTRRVDSLDGWFGRDRLIGRAGDDSLIGEVTYGGPGDDYIMGSTRTADCGSGRDRLVPSIADGSHIYNDMGAPHHSQPAHPSCELMTNFLIETRLSVHLRNGRLRVHLRNTSPDASRATVALYAWPMRPPGPYLVHPGSILARRELRLQPKETRSAALKLTRVGRRYLAAGRRRVTLVVSSYEPDVPYATGVVLTLR